MKTDMESIQDMLSKRNVFFQTEQGNKLYIGDSVLLFDTLGRIIGGSDAECDCDEINYDDCSNCEQMESKIDKAIAILQS